MNHYISATIFNTSLEPLVEQQGVMDITDFPTTKCFLGVQTKTGYKGSHRNDTDETSVPPNIHHVLLCIYS